MFDSLDDVRWGGCGSRGGDGEVAVPLPSSTLLRSECFWRDAWGKTNSDDQFQNKGMKRALGGQRNKSS